MSADNGIYILHLADGWRVKECQGLDDIYDTNVLARYFRNCEVIPSLDEAFKEADRLLEEAENDDFCPIVEYGIVTISLPHVTVDFTIDTFMTDCLVCPYCGDEQGEDDPPYGDQGEWICEACGEEFKFYAEKTIHYTTEKIKKDPR